MSWWGIGIGIFVVLFGFVVFFGAPYVPSQRKYVRRAFEKLYPLSKDDLVVDMGSGDGIVLRVARSFGAKAVGYEINPLLVLISRLLSRGDERVEVRLENFWSAELPEETTLIYAFAVERDGRKVQRKVQDFANRTGRPIALLCLGSPLKGVQEEAVHDAYWLYRFYPLQANKLKV